MQMKNTSLKTRLSLIFSGALSLLLISCGTHNNPNYSDADGIYNVQPTEEMVVESQAPSDSYYKQYFNSKADTFDDLPKEGAIFTDINAYSTNETLDSEGYIVIEERQPEENYGGWGENSHNINGNVYGNNWGGMGAAGVWGRPFWWYGSGWGFHNQWASPFWGIGWGWGYPFYGNFGMGYPFFNGGYYNNFNNAFYGNGYHGYAYTRGRRNSDIYNSTSPLRNISNARDARISRATNYGTRNISSRRDNHRGVQVRNDRYNRNSQGIRDAANTGSRVNSRYARPSNSRTVRPSNSRTIRPNTNSRSTRPSMNSSRPSSRGVSRPSGSRSSGLRGSSGGGRSGGASRGGGSRGRGGRGI
jgi:hypothetical protein